jgi:sulfur-oxidizing protein SoxA
MKSLLTSLLLTSTLLTAGEQFTMSDADRAIYKEMLENNPADIFVEEGSEYVEEELGGDVAIAKFLEVTKKELPKTVASFPTYIEKMGDVVALDQVIQAIQTEQGKERLPLNSDKMIAILSYVKSLGNDELVTLKLQSNEAMKRSYTLGKKLFNTPRGGRGLSCLSCHNKAVEGASLRTQLLPSLGEAAAGATWPAYRMTRSTLVSLQQRIQGCMEDALQKPLPLGSKEMVSLELYITSLAETKKKTVVIPGLKR